MQVNAIKALGANADLIEQQVPGSNSARAAGAEDKVNGGVIREGTVKPEVPDRDAVSQAVKEINEAVKSLGSSLRFHVDDASKRVVIDVVDETTGEVLQQIPPEVSRRLAETLGKAAGLLVNKRA